MTMLGISTLSTILTQSWVEFCDNIEKSYTRNYDQDYVNKALSIELIEATYQNLQKFMKKST